MIKPEKEGSAWEIGRYKTGRRGTGFGSTGNITVSATTVPLALFVHVAAQTARDCANFWTPSERTNINSLKFSITRYGLL